MSPSCTNPPGDGDEDRYELVGALAGGRAGAGRRGGPRRARRHSLARVPRPLRANARPDAPRCSNQATLGAKTVRCRAGVGVAAPLVASSPLALLFCSVRSLPRADELPPLFRTGEKLLKSQLSRTPEWACAKSRQEAAARCTPARASLSRVLRGHETSASLRKARGGRREWERAGVGPNLPTSAGTRSPRKPTLPALPLTRLRRRT